MTNGFALNHDKSLQIYFFCLKRQAKNDFLKDVESTVTWILTSDCSQKMPTMILYYILETDNLNTH